MNNSEKMRELISYIQEELTITAIPVRVKNEKRWESMDEISDGTPLDGMAQRLSFDDGYGIVVYDWNELSDEKITTIRDYYFSL